MNYDSATKTMDFRHYAIKLVPVGLSRGVKKIVQAQIPNLSRCKDYSEFLTKATMPESEAEDDPDSHVVLPQKLSSRGNLEEANSSIRLYELGPRITMQVWPAELILCDSLGFFSSSHLNLTDLEREKSGKILTFSPLILL